MRICGVIPAKGSSERVTGKNRQRIRGVPLFLWAANNLSRVLPRADIFIDSDAEDILALAASHGFGTIRRPDNLATNATDGNQLLAWQASQVVADIYLQHLPPMCFLRETTIRTALEALAAGALSATGVIRDHAYRWDETGPLYDVLNIPNSFTLPESIREGMGFYAVRADAFARAGHRVPEPRVLLPLDRYEAIDIDTFEDLAFARTIAAGLGPDSPWTEGIERLVDSGGIRLAVFDVDGVLTDGGMSYSEAGATVVQAKTFNARDGIGIKRLLKAGIEVGLLSNSETPELIRARADTLGIRYVSGQAGRKIEVLQRWCQALDIPMSAVAYVGDDVNDLEILSAVGLGACPADAEPSVAAAAAIRLGRAGGRGCVRELIDHHILPVEEPAR